MGGYHQKKGGTYVKHVITAATVDEAISKGLQEKDWVLEEVEVEILDQGKTGMLRKRPAKVSLIKKDAEDEKNSANRLLHQVVDDFKQEGYEQKPKVDEVYWQSEQLIIQPDFFEKTVFLVPPEHCILCINDQSFVNMTELVMSDHITNPLVPEDLEQWVEIKLLKDNLMASIQLKPSAAYTLQPKVIKASATIEIEFIEQHRKELPFKTQDIRTYLEGNGIIHGIDNEAIEQWLLNEVDRTEPMLIAQGEESVDGRSTQFVELFQDVDFLKSAQKKYENIGEDETIDWFGMHDFGSVLTGDKLLEIIPATEGIHGTNVLGELISAKDGAVIQVQIGKGTEFSEDECYVMATMDGRPEFTKNKMTVHPLYVVNGDLTLETGSIKFNGDVLVTGDVCEGLGIDATGNIEVKGSVISANLKADCHVTVVKNILGSKVTAGGIDANIRIILYEMEDVLKKFEFLEQAYHQLKQSTAFMNNQEIAQAGAGQIIKYILENKLPTLDKELRQFYSNYKKTKIDWDSIDKWFEQTLRKMIGSGPLQIETIEECNIICAQGREISTQLQEETEQCFDVFAYYIHNSNIQSSGHIQVNGLGCYNSLLVAGEDIVIRGKEGMVRGGSLQAQTEIKVKALGGPGDVKTKAVLKSSKGAVTAEIVYSGVAINIAGIVYQVHDAYELVQFVFDAHKNKIKAISAEESS